MNTPHVFRNESEWFVASSPEDALAVYNEYADDCGLDPDERDPDLVQLPDDSKLSIRWEDADPAGVIELTCAEWAARNGRGFLGSENY